MPKNEPKTLQQKMDALDEMVKWFEGPDFQIEQAIDKYKEAEKFAAEIEADLSEFKNEITVLKKKFDQ